MSRWVVSGREGLKAGVSGESDGPIDRVVKYVPAEVVSAYTLLFSALVAMKLPPNQRPELVAVGLIGVFVIVTIAYIGTKTPPGATRKAHLLVSPLSFIAWSYPISSALLGEWFIGLASFVLQAVVVALSLFVKPRD